MLATAGLLVTLLVALGLRLAGLTQMTYRQWTGAVVLTLVVQGVLWLSPRADGTPGCPSIPTTSTCPWWPRSSC